VATALPDLTALDSEALRELVVEKQTEIENLKLLILKLAPPLFRFLPRSVSDTTGPATSG
jgi:hypothetical protein